MKRTRFLTALAVILSLTAPAQPARADVLDGVGTRSWHGGVTRNYCGPISYYCVSVTVIVNRHDNPLDHRCQALVRFDERNDNPFRVRMGADMLRLTNDGSIVARAGALDRSTRAGVISHSTTWYGANGLNGGMRAAALNFIIHLQSGHTVSGSLTSNLTFVECG